MQQIPEQVVYPLQEESVCAWPSEDTRSNAFEVHRIQQENRRLHSNSRCTHSSRFGGGKDGTVEFIDDLDHKPNARTLYSMPSGCVSGFSLANLC
jgi:hypothetical protein